MSNNKIAFGKRTFSEVKEQLYSLIKEYYPEVLGDFTDSSVGAMLVDLNAGVSNTLSVNTDRAFQETQREFAQQRESLLGIAKTMGFSIPNKRASVTVVDYTVNIPAKGDEPDESYYPTLSVFSQVVGGGKTFENDEIIDWKEPNSPLGFPNRSIIPNKDSNGIVLNYEVTKREVVLNGSTNVFKKVIRSTETVPFYKLRLPDTNVLEISDIIVLNTTNSAGNPDETTWQEPETSGTGGLKFYEVDNLAEQRVFLDDPNGGTNELTTGSTGIKAGIWRDITTKFIKEYTSRGFCELTFGGGNGELDSFKEGLLKAGVTNQEFLNNYLNNTALGEKLQNETTLFVRYRTGGGVSSNLGTGVLTTLGNHKLTVLGSRQDFNQQVERSLIVNNPIPAIGGNDGLSIEQIRNLIAYNFSSQNRDVTIDDYLNQIFKMPGKYGSPFRGNASRENNKIVISILGLNENGSLDNSSNTLLKQNITEYLSKFRMVNDYVEIRDARIFNLAFEIDLYIQEHNEHQIANSVIRTVTNYFDVNTHTLNEDIFLTDMVEQINNVTGVVNVLNLKVFNKVGDQYSLNPIEQDLINETTGEIKIINNAIYSTEDSMFEIKFPEKDIKLFLRKKANLSV